MVHTFGNDSDESESLSSDDESETGANTMMSLLSSYCGVEDDPVDTTTEKKPKKTSDIDSVDFDHEAYVKRKFDTCEVNELLKDDTRLVQDIKTLDSDMQMLVYENYNKFISATETIKRMKTNVEAMDDDMEAVTSKMGTIMTTTTRLDSTLNDKRTHIDKLVRIKRLLTRLEFLSELPERLESMIEQGMYKQAIQLYKKTIKVLTKQEHVLSFKKIKLKTEEMMTDLRRKVLSLMDSSTLEAQELTQYVGILKLMECSRELVMEKFLTAHKRRSTAKIKQFLQERDEVIKMEEGEEGNSGDDNVLSVMNVRNFHQNVLIGLIESSNGVSEMFKVEENEKDSSYIGGEDSSSDDNVMTLSMAYDELQAMIGIVMPDYIECITSSLAHFFHKYNKAYNTHQNLLAQIAHEDMLKSMENDLNNNDTILEEEEVEDDGESDDNSENEQQESQNEEENDDGDKEKANAEIRSSFKQVNEERLLWISLTRQVILDCQYLDSGTENVRPDNCDASLPHADSVASAVLKILDDHFNTLFDGHMQYFKSDIVKAIPTFKKLSNMNAELRREIDNLDAPSCRSLFPQRLSKAQSIIEDFTDLFDSIFHKVCRDSKAVYEAHSVTRVGKSNVGDDLVFKFCNGIAEVLETLGGVAIRPSGSMEIYDENTNKSTITPLLDYDSTSSTNSVRSARSGRSTQLYNGHCCYEFSLVPDDETQASSCLLSAVVISTVLPNLADRLEEVMKNSLMSSNVSKSIQEKCMSRLQDSCLVQLEAFIVYHADIFSDKLAGSLRKALLVDDKARDTLITTRDLSVTPATLSCTSLIDNLTLLSCCLLLENLPAPQIRSVNLSAGDIRGSADFSDRDGGSATSGSSRRASVRAANNQAMYNYGLQLDIERMFSKKVNVFDADSYSLNLECVLGVVMKAGVKASMEEIRVNTVGPLALSQLTIDFNFIKQVMGCVLKDAADVECLIEEVLVTLASRSMEDPSGRELTTALPKAVNDGLYMAGKKCVLLR